MNMPVYAIKAKTKYYLHNTTGRKTTMAKKGMRRPDPSDPHGTESNKKQNFPKNDMNPVPEIQGKAKTGKAKAGNTVDPGEPQ